MCITIGVAVLCTVLHSIAFISSDASFLFQLASAGVVGNHMQQLPNMRELMQMYHMLNLEGACAFWVKVDFRTAVTDISANALVHIV